MRVRCALALIPFFAPSIAWSGPASEFCLQGQFDLGVRLQGMQPDVAERSEARWCVVSESGGDRVRFSASGKSNPDMSGDWTVLVLPPDRVRIVNTDSPDYEFKPVDSLAEARRIRRIDPARLVAELKDFPSWSGPADATGWRSVSYPQESAGTRVRIVDDKLLALQTTADLPLRGRVPVEWHWDWADAERPVLRLLVDGDLLFNAQGSWRSLDDAAAKTWQGNSDPDPVAVPGENWPARVHMRRVELGRGLHLVTGVRTGFQHLVAQTDDGLVVADAPAGWVEMHQIPPADLVPGLGISGLSEQLIDFLRSEFPQSAVRAAALTHAHDDHAGGARAFAAAGADVYAPADDAAFLQAALNRSEMPADELQRTGSRVNVIGVASPVTLEDSRNPLQLLPIGPGPHVGASLGILAVEHGIFFVSDLHVPNSDDDTPRADRAATECWFARWAVSNLPAETVVVNSHSRPQTPVSRLARYLESETCGKEGGARKIYRQMYQLRDGPQSP